METSPAKYPLRRNPSRTLPGLLLTLVLTAGCASEPPPVGNTLNIVVSILPQIWFVEQIGGESVTVTPMVGPGHSPATYEPTPRQLARLQTADLYFSIGVPFERGLLPKIAALPQGPPVAGPRPDLSQPVHEHGHESGLDPHIWLSPRLARTMADTVYARLAILRPARQAEFQARHQALIRQLTALESELQDMLTPYAGRPFFVFHPAFGHFAAAFNLRQVSVEASGHEPGPRQLATLIDQARQDGATAIVVQPQFSRKSAGTVAAAAGLEVVVLDPLAAEYDTNLRKIARTLVRILDGSGK